MRPDRSPISGSQRQPDVRAAEQHLATAQARVAPAGFQPAGAPSRLHLLHRQPPHPVAGQQPAAGAAKALRTAAQPRLGRRAHVVVGGRRKPTAAAADRRLQTGHRRHR